MNGVPLFAYLVLGLILFCIGAVGVLIRKNPIVVFMCIELMLNAVNLTFLSFARYLPSPSIVEKQAGLASVTGEMVVIFVMAVAAAEVAVGLGIMMAIFRLRSNVDIDELRSLQG